MAVFGYRPKLVGMKRSNKYKLHIKIHLKKAPLAQAGKAIGVLCRKHLIPQQILCTTERTNDTEVCKKAEIVIRKLLGQPSPWGQLVDRVLPKTRTISLDDEKVHQLAECWGSRGIAEHMVVVPHIFYRRLLKCSMRNIESQAPEILRRVCILFDYAVLEKVPDILRPCLFGERAQVLEYAQKKKLAFIDSGHQMFLENLISVACYMLPAKYLVFKDDDFFLNSAASVEKLLDPLKRGYLLSGKYVKAVDRIHTCFFALRPEYLRDELLLFDNGENLYTDELTDTGTVTYRALSNRDKGAFILGDYWDDDLTLGRHLCHCTAELWYDLPQALKMHFRTEMLPKKYSKMKLDVEMLLEALALLYKVRRHASHYDAVSNELRQKGRSDFSPYFEKIYNNHHWLGRHADG